MNKLILAALCFSAVACSGPGFEARPDVEQPAGAPNTGNTANYVSNGNAGNNAAAGKEPVIAGKNPGVAGMPINIAGEPTIIAGSGNNGSGDAGSGNKGSGEAGSGDAGTGNVGNTGSGNAGGGGTGNAGSGNAGSGNGNTGNTAGTGNTTGSGSVAGNNNTGNTANVPSTCTGGCTCEPSSGSNLPTFCSEGGYAYFFAAFKCVAPPSTATRCAKTPIASGLNGWCCLTP